MGEPYILSQPRTETSHAQPADAGVAMSSAANMADIRAGTV